MRGYAPVHSTSKSSVGADENRVSSPRSADTAHVERLQADVRQGRKRRAAQRDLARLAGVGHAHKVIAR